MPEYLEPTHLIWLKLCWPMVALAVLVTTLIWAGCWPYTAPGHRAAAFWAPFGFAALGMAVGVLTGDSGDQAAASVLPAVLTVVGGLAAYLVTRSRETTTLVATSIASLGITLLLGALIGMENRRIEASKAELSTQVRSLAGDPGALAADIEKRLAAATATK